MGRATGGLDGLGYRGLTVLGMAASQERGTSQVTKAVVEARKASCYQGTRGCKYICINSMLSMLSPHAFHAF